MITTPVVISRELTLDLVYLHELKRDSHLRLRSRMPVRRAGHCKGTQMSRVRFNWNRSQRLRVRFEWGLTYFRNRHTCGHCAVDTGQERMLFSLFFRTLSWIHTFSDFLSLSFLLYFLYTIFTPFTSPTETVTYVQ